MFILLCVSSPLFAVELKLFIWEGYISQDVLNRFAKEKGITVNLIYFDSDQTRDEVIASTGKESFDLVLFHNVAAQVFGKNNYLTAINSTNVPNLVNVDKQWRESCGNFGIPYFYGTLGIVYDKSKVNPPPQSWHDLLAPSKEHQGHVNMVEDSTDVLIPPLLYLGYTINSEETDELRQAYDLLLDQLPSITGYKYVLTNLGLVSPSHDIHMALAYSGDQYTLNDQTGSENWQYVIPKEGTAI